MSTVQSALLVGYYVSATAFVVITFVWTWRDMASRDRPVWLRVVVVALLYPTLVGMFVWMLDLSRHPHNPALSRWEILRQSQGARSGGA